MTHSQKRTILFAALALVAAALAFWIVKVTVASTAGTPTVSADSESSSTSDSTVITAAGASAEFVFSDSGIAVTGSSSGTEISGTALTIDEAGIYTVSGACADGSIKIKKGTTGVTLILNGLDLTSSATAPITCAKSSEVTILAADGTENTLTDSAQNNDDEYPDAENAVIKCKDGSTVTLGGTGSLRINANGKNGIKSGATTDEAGEASLTIEELSLTINASVGDAINAEQTLHIPSGTLTIDAADDAIHADYDLNIGASGTGGPSITITGCREGLEAAALNIFSGNIDITATDDCLNAANSDLSGYDFTMNISGGTIRAYTSGGDGFDSNGDLTISGGTVVVWTASAADNQPQRQQTLRPPADDYERRRRNGRRAAHARQHEPAQPGPAHEHQHGPDAQNEQRARQVRFQQHQRRHHAQHQRKGQHPHRKALHPVMVERDDV